MQHGRWLPCLGFVALLLLVRSPDLVRDLVRDVHGGRAAGEGVGVEVLELDLRRRLGRGGGSSVGGRCRCGTALRRGRWCSRLLGWLQLAVLDARCVALGDDFRGGQLDEVAARHTVPMRHLVAVPHTCAECLRSGRGARAGKTMMSKRNGDENNERNEQECKTDTQKKYTNEKNLHSRSKNSTCIDSANPEQLHDRAKSPVVRVDGAVHCQLSLTHLIVPVDQAVQQPVQEVHAALRRLLRACGGCAVGEEDARNVLLEVLALRANEDVAEHGDGERVGDCRLAAHKAYKVIRVDGGFPSACRTHKKHITKTLI